MPPFECSDRLNVGSLLVFRFTYAPIYLLTLFVIPKASAASRIDASNLSLQSYSTIVVSFVISINPFIYIKSDPHFFVFNCIMAVLALFSYNIIKIINISCIYKI